MSQSVSSAETIQSLLLQSRAQIVKYLPRHLDADKMIYVALETVRADSFLWQCEPLSILQAVLEASQLGLMLGNKLGHAYLVPRRDKKASNIRKCQLLIGYRGFIALAHRTGKVSSIFPAIVHQGDQFSVKLGTSRQLHHAPALDPANRGAWIGAYAVVEFRDGRTDFEWMTRQEIEKVRQCSESADEEWSPWRRFEDEMIKKSPIRRMAKRLCLSSEDMTLVEAAARDECREMGIEGEQAALSVVREPQRRVPSGNSAASQAPAPDVASTSGEKQSTPSRGEQARSASQASVQSDQVNASKDAIVEPRRNVPTVANETQSAERPPWEPEPAPAPTNGQETVSAPSSHGGAHEPAARAWDSNGATSGNGMEPKTIAMRGIVGAFEPDEAGRTLRRNASGVEYVVFKISQNGQGIRVYCNRPEVLAEIASHQGREVRAQLTVTGNHGHQYYVLDRFVEG